jgi:hypothetical protein
MIAFRALRLEAARKEADVVHTSDARHFVLLESQKLLAGVPLATSEERR